MVRFVFLDLLLVACALGAGDDCFAASSALAISTNGCNIGIEVGLK